LADLVAALSLVADLGFGQPMEHVLHTCVMARRLGEVVGADEEEHTETYWVSMLGMVGCIADSYELRQLFGDDIALRAGIYDMGPSSVAQMRYFLGRAGSDAATFRRLQIKGGLVASAMRAVEVSLIGHCEVTSALAHALGLPANVGLGLGHVFARWDGKGVPKGVGHDDIRISARLQSLCDGAEVHHRAGGAEAAVAFARHHAGGLFDPELVAAFAASAASITQGLDGDLWQEVVESAPEPNRRLTGDDLTGALRAVADFTDLKSPSFASHSRGVGDLAAAAVTVSGLPIHAATTARHAGYVHELGRAGVPNTIWDKPGSFTGAERERMQMHAYYTDRMLRRANLPDLAEVASANHERLDGTGYPRSSRGDSIPRVGALLAAADVYHALGEARPHRPAMTNDEAIRVFRAEGREGRLDAAAVDAVLTAAGQQTGKRPTSPAGLSPRELEVLTLLARGSTARDISAALSITHKTARNFIERIYTKTGVSTRSAATLFATRHDIV
jgi:HD-GYP domain-containing protein (c-di-GMP phosphodiesterase class II)